MALHTLQTHKDSHHMKEKYTISREVDEMCNNMSGSYHSNSFLTGVTDPDFTGLFITNYVCLTTVDGHIITSCTCLG